MKEQKKIFLRKSNKTNQVDERHDVKEGFYRYIHSYRLRIVGLQKNIFKIINSNKTYYEEYELQDGDGHMMC